MGVESRYARFYLTQTNTKNENERKGQGYAKLKCQKNAIYIHNGVVLNSAST